MGDIFEDDNYEAKDARAFARQAERAAAVKAEEDALREKAIRKKEREELLKEISSYYHAVRQPHWPCDVCRTLRLVESIIKGRK